MSTIRPITEKDRTWMRKRWMEWWTALFVISKPGKIHHVDEVQGFVAEKKGKPIGLITYKITNDECEITSLNSIEEGVGIGTNLLSRLEETAKQAGCTRIWVITTNDNLRALGFYQKRGYYLVTIYREAMKEVRKLKPNLPLLGMNDIPLRDHIELEKQL
jgi:ribosomal protein S18 acetylase RimI-like enzyme